MPGFFNKNARGRIRKTVKRVEAMPIDRVGRKRGTPRMRGEWWWGFIAGNEQITDETRWKYGWNEVQPTSDNFQVLADGRSGTTSADFMINALEVPETLIKSPIPDGTPVQIWQGFDLDDEPCYWFAAGGGESLPNPGALYQVLQLQGDPDLVPVWDYVRAHG